MYTHTVAPLLQAGRPLHTFDFNGRHAIYRTDARVPAILPFAYSLVIVPAGK